MKTEFILFEMRKPVTAPQWWEGHVIHYKEYPLKGGIGLATLTLCARDGGQQKFAPWKIAQPITVTIGGKRIKGEVYRVAVHRPGWDTDQFTDDDLPNCEWVVTVCFPRIPKNHLKLP